MIYKSELSNILSIPVYIFENEECGKILKHTFFETVNIYEINEFILLEEKGKYYVMGATPNTNYIGFEVKKEEAEKITKDRELIRLYNKYDFMAFMY